VQRLIPCCAFWCLFAVSLTSPASAAVLSSDITRQPLAEALTALAEQTGLQLFYLTAIAETQQSGRARAGTSPSAALAQLLEGTGLQFRFVNARAVRIFAPPAAPPRTSPYRQQTRRRSDFWPIALEEVVVTATRREEQLGDVPISIAVWTEVAMEKFGVKGMDQIGTLTPGVEFDFITNFTSDLYTNLVIRGVTDRHGATTGVFIDDTPLPAARAESFGRSFPWAFELDRVEVLRGPQAHCWAEVRWVARFGSSSTRQPSQRTRVSHAWKFATTERGEPSYEVGAAVGGPLRSRCARFSRERLVSIRGGVC
jgi:outer membrane receptor protein involved in Fe transport